MISKLIFTLLILNILSTNGQQIRIENFNEDLNKTDMIYIPSCNFEPKSHNFSYIHEGGIYQTKFEIWNSGDGILEWSLRTNRPWINVEPRSGNSSGEHDIINVTINSTGLTPGEYETGIFIHSMGDWKYYVYFTITETILDFSPKYQDFGMVEVGEILQSEFEIWNSGQDTLIWNLNKSNPWISFSPENGISDGEHRIVKVTIQTENLNYRYNKGIIYINSNGGNNCYLINLSINHHPKKPSLSGRKSGQVNKEYTYLGNTSDPDGDNLSYFFDWGDRTNSSWLGPYSSDEIVSASHYWKKYGSYKVKLKSKDQYGLESEWSNEIIVTMPKEINKISNSYFYTQIIKLLSIV
jgi:hypothetical protein